MYVGVLAQTLVNGLFAGGVLALVSIGLTMIYGVMIIINFAHGEFVMLGMYLSYWAFVLGGVDPYLSVFMTAIIMFAFGALVQRLLVQRVMAAHILNQIVLLLGLSILLVGLAQFFWMPVPRTLQLPYATAGVEVAGLILNIPRGVAFLASLVIASALYVFLQRTRVGKSIRACAESREAAQLVGINVKRVYMLTFGIGAAVTGVAGALLAPSYPITPTVGATWSVIAFVVVVLGTMGNFMGAFLGGLLIGVAEAFGGLLLGGDVKEVVSMLIFILVLLLKPQGLFGKADS
jgi:branched-chain amino acid transport system permease protein